MGIELTDFPEEILERIFAFALAPTLSVWATPLGTAPSLLARTPPALLTVPEASHSGVGRNGHSARTGTLHQPVSAYAPLLVCKHLQRIGTPLLYADLRLASPAQAGLALRTLNQRPDLVACVRSLCVGGVWTCLLDLVRLFAAGGDQPIRLESFDFRLDFMNIAPNTLSPDVDAFCAAISLLPTIGTVQHLTVRRAPNAYINLPGPMHILETLGSVIEDWASLKSINVTFPLPGPSLQPTLTTAIANLHPPQQFLMHPPLPQLGGVPNQTQGGSKNACSRFVLALGCAPGLKVVYAHIPSLWNTSFLEISKNPSLEALVLTPWPATMGAHLFLTFARRHERLYELIEAGNRLSPPPAPTPTPGRQTPSLRPEGLLHEQSGAGRIRAHTMMATSRAPAGSSFLYSTSAPDLPTIQVSPAGGASTSTGNAAGGAPTDGRLGVTSRSRSARRNTIFV